MRNIYIAIISSLLVVLILFTIFNTLDIFKEQETFIEGNRSRRRREARPTDSVKRTTKARKALNKNYKYGNNVPTVIPEKDDITDEAPTSNLYKLTEDDMSNVQYMDKLYNR